MREPSADLLLVLNFYGYAIPACHTSGHAGRASKPSSCKEDYPLLMQIADHDSGSSTVYNHRD